MLGFRGRKNHVKKMKKQAQKKIISQLKAETTTRKTA